MPSSSSLLFSSVVSGIKPSTWLFIVSIALVGMQHSWVFALLFLIAACFIYYLINSSDINSILGINDDQDDDAKSLGGTTQDENDAIEDAEIAESDSTGSLKSFIVDDENSNDSTYIPDDDENSNDSTYIPDDDENSNDSNESLADSDDDTYVPDENSIESDTSVADSVFSSVSTIPKRCTRSSERR